VARERIELRGPSELGRMMAEYNDIDIGLDPTPFNGGATTFQALWMGVPVVTLAGGNFCQRMGASILGGIGLPELVAQSSEEYVTIVTTLAADRARLAALKQGLRTRLAASALGDPTRYTRNLEAAYRRLWRRYAAAD